MSWEERILEGAYTATDGVRLTFQWERVSRTTPLRRTAFDFPGVFNSYVQDNGSGSRQYPIRAIFTGENCDVEATTFERACLKPGVGRLEHPLYGAFNAIPLGEVKRSDDPTSEANQSVVEVTFWTTTDAVYPNPAGNPRNEIVASLAAFNAAGARQFSSASTLGTVAQKANAAASVRSMMSLANASLGEVANATPSVSEQFRAAAQLILGGLEILIENPLELATQLAEFVQIPARSAATIAAKLTAYANLAQSIFGSRQGSPANVLQPGAALPRRNIQVANDFQIANVVAGASVAGTIRSTIETTFATRPLALTAAASALAQMDAVVAWRDDAYAAVGAVSTLGDNARVDTGESQQALLAAAGLTAGHLVQVSFQLVPEKRIVLDRARTIIDLAAELYGSVDDKLDLLIESNGLSGSEILELPRGREIVYYPTTVAEAA